MGDYNKQICRLCLDVTPSCECEVIKDIKKETLEVLLSNIDFDIGGDAVACNRCVERLQNFYDFKSHCIATHLKLIKEEICLESSQICQLCLMIEVNTLNYKNDPDEVLKHEVSLKEMIGNCFPEVDFHTVGDSLLCHTCQGRVKEYYEFMKNFEKVQQRIHNYCQVESQGTVGRITFGNMLQFKDYKGLGEPTVIKEECPDAESIDANVKNEENPIKSEEVHIKDENLDNGMEKTESGQLEDYDSTGKNGALKRKRIKDVSEGKQQHFCPKCPFSAKHISGIKRHMRDHSDNEMHRCNFCNFVADAKVSLKAHMTIHRGLSMAYGCSECTYETNTKCFLVKHLLKHKDKSEVEMQKCSLCPYESKYKDSLIKHQKRQHSGNVKVHECKECSFSTKYKASLVKHVLMHKNSEEVPKYMCAKCEFETKQKVNLIMHMTTHDPNAGKIFQCEKCPFQSKWQLGVLGHMRVHTDECSLRCEECTFSTKHRHNLAVHKRNIHPKDGERKIYKCTLCSYQALTSTTFKDHMAIAHMDPSVPIMKCPHCPYVSSVKDRLLRHMSRHNIEDKPMLECKLCPYVTWEKLDLRSHSLAHGQTTKKCNFQTKHKKNMNRRASAHNRPAGETVHKCGLCEFSTKVKRNLTRHRLKHMGPGETPMYFCATCDYRTKYKHDLGRHMPRCSRTKTI